MSRPPAASLVLREGLVVGLGVLFGLVWGRRTGWGCGGLITPGLLALHAASPHRVGLALLLGVLLAAPLGLLARFLGLYGRERAGAAMLLALAVRLALAPFVPPVARDRLGRSGAHRRGRGTAGCGDDPLRRAVLWNCRAGR